MRTVERTLPLSPNTGYRQVNRVGQAVSAERLSAGWWGVVVLFLVHGLIVSTWVSRIAAIKSRLGLSDGSFGLALFGAAAGAVAAVPLAGWSIARHGSKRTVRWTAYAFCASLLLLAGAPNVTALFVGLFLYGAMTGANDVAINAQAVGVEKQLGRPAMARFHSMFSFGGMIGAAIGGVLAYLGISPMLHFALAALAIMVLLGRTTAGVIDFRGVTKHSAEFPSKRPPSALIALSAIGFCIFLSEGAIADWSAVYVRQVLHAGEAPAAAAYAAFAAAMAFFRFHGDAVTSCLGRAGIIRAGGLVAACGLALLVSADSVAVALTGLAITGAGFSSIVPVVFAAGSRIPGVPEATGVATVSGVGYLGFLIGPPMIGLVSEVSSLRAALGFLVLLSCTAALLVNAVRLGGKPDVDPLRD